MSIAVLTATFDTQSAQLRRSVPRVVASALSVPRGLLFVPEVDRLQRTAVAEKPRADLERRTELGSMNDAAWQSLSLSHSNSLSARKEQVDEPH